MSTVQLWPPVSGVSDPSTMTWYPGVGRWSGWMTAAVARSLPGVARGLALIAGQLSQMPLDDYAGVTPRPRPPLLDSPDPDNSRAWFVQVQVEDYLLNGNAVHYVTSRDKRTGWPTSVVWIPAEWVQIVVDPITQEHSYWVGGMELRRSDVVHVKRGADRMNPHRGVGVVEQHLDALGTVRDQHRYENEVLKGGAVPSVAVIAPNPRVSDEEATAAKSAWVDKFGGPVREPGIFPKGTEVIPLAWSPSDSQLVEARQLSLTDQANMLNLDGWWLGAPSKGLAYKSPGPMFLQLLRQTLEPIAAPFEDVWSAAWLPRGRRVRFDRRAVLADDMQTMVATASAAVAAGLWTVEEGRVYMGMSPELPESAAAKAQAVTTTSPVATVEAEDDVEVEEDPS